MQRRNRAFTQRRKRAFTLIELLVVIAIIAILAAILFPVFAQAKLAAKKSADLASVKQTNLSMIMYAGDADDTAPGQNNDPVQGYPNPWNAGYFPGGLTLGYMTPPLTVPSGDMYKDMAENWGRSIQPYMKSLQLMVSPGAPKDTVSVDWGYKNAAGAGNSTWFMNGAVQRQSLTSVSAPSDLVVFQSALTTTCEARTQPVRDNGFEGRGGPRCHSIEIFGAGVTFGKGANYGWLDGHASYKQRTAITFRNMGASGTVHRKRPSETDVPNTTSLYDSSKDVNMDWTTSAYCDLGAL